MMRKYPATASSRFRVLVAGDLRHHEFAEASAWLQAHADLCSAGTNATGPLDFILLACARRGQFTGDDVQRWRTAHPLARLVALTGSWCDGPWRRPCDLLPGVAIVPWHRWTAWAEVNHGQLARRRLATWTLPETTTADELADFWSRQPLVEHRGLILLDAASAETAEVLADVLRAGGFSAVWRSPASEGFVDGVRAIVCEANDGRRETLDRISELARQFAPSPVLAVINFPRAEDIAQILAAGAAAAVGKPFTLHEILAQLGDALRRHKQGRESAA